MELALMGLMFLCLVGFSVDEISFVPRYFLSYESACYGSIRPLTPHNTAYYGSKWPLTPRNTAYYGSKRPLTPHSLNPETQKRRCGWRSLVPNYVGLRAANVFFEFSSKTLCGVRGFFEMGPYRYALREALSGSARAYRWVGKTEISAYLWNFSFGRFGWKWSFSKFFNP